MDALDRLIDLSRLQGALDLRCLLGGQWELDHPPAPVGEATYHVVLSGGCTLKLRGQADVVLETGDIAMLPRGDAHLLVNQAALGNTAGTSMASKDAAGSSQKPSDAHGIQARHNGVVTVRSNTLESNATLDLLCGRFTYANKALLMDVLPSLVKISFASNEVPDLAHLVGMMRKESSDAEAGAHSIVSALSTALFTLLLRAYLAQQPSTTDILALLANPRLGPSVIAMLERPAEKWTIELLAQQSAMSRATYMRAFSALTTDSPIGLLGRIRMQLAGTLLKRTARSIGEIADEVGYQSESAFSRKFKDAYGVGPGQFRQARD